MADGWLDILPDVHLLPTMGGVDFTVATALAEYIDNSLDNRPDDGQVHVAVTLDGDRGVITVSDDGTGMTLATLKDAMTPGHRSSVPGRIGQYGMGLKAASQFLARDFDVTTKASDPAATAYRISYREESFIRSGHWQIPYAQLDSGDISIGTTIVLTGLRVDLVHLDRSGLRLALSTIYRTYLGKTLTLRVDGEDLAPLTVPCYDEPTWHVEFSVSGGNVVRGEIRIMNIPFNERPLIPAGLELIRRGRLIESGVSPGHGSRNRLRHLLGTVHLDDFEVVNNKTRFRRDSREWLDFASQMKRFFEDNAIPTKAYKKSLAKGRLGEGEPRRVADPRSQPQPLVPREVNVPSRTVRPRGHSASPRTGGLEGPGERLPREVPPPDNAVAPRADVDAETQSPRARPADAQSQQPRTGRPAVQTRHRVTTRTVRDLRKTSLHVKDLHPEIAQASISYMRRGETWIAVWRGVSALGALVRRVGNLTKDLDTGTAMALLASDKKDKPAKSARLRITTGLGSPAQLPEDCADDEQIGAQYLLAGCWSGIRNVVIHKEEGGRHITGPEAMECLALISMLYRRLERATYVPPPDADEA